MREQHVEPLRSPPGLRLVDRETGEAVEEHCPGCLQRDEMIERLQADVENLEKEGRRYRRKISDLTRERHKELHLHPRAETVRRVYALWRQLCKPKAQEQIPDDRMQTGLDRTKHFSEEQMIKAVHGAASGLARDAKSGRVYDDWENIFRNTRNVWIYIEHADRAEEQLRARAPLGMLIYDVLRAGGLVDQMRSTDRLVRAVCPGCGSDLALNVPAGFVTCLGECLTDDVDAALERLAGAYGIEWAWGDR